MGALCSPLRAAERCDSAVVNAPWIGAAGIGAASTVAGAVSRPNTSAYRYGPAPGSTHHSRITDVAQYAPLAFPWVLKAAGGATRSGWGRMAVSQGAGAALTVGVAKVVKHSSDELRPDGRDRRSFPSGHAAMAYMGATMMSRELAWRSPWYGFGAYAAAAAVGMQRVVSRRHYPADVAAGAGIGILGAELGYLAGDLIFGSRGLDSRYDCRRGAAANTPRLSLSSGLIFTPGKVDVQGAKLNRRPALYTALGGQYPVAEHWSVGGGLNLISTPVECISAADAAPSAPLMQNQLGVSVRPEYCATVGGLALLELYAECGYRWNISPRSRLGLGAGSYQAGAGVAASIPVTDCFSFGAEVGYTASRYRYRLPGSDIAAGTDHGIIAGASARVNF